MRAPDALLQAAKTQAIAAPVKQAFQAVKARTGEPNAGIQSESHDVHVTVCLCSNVKGLSNGSWPPACR